jgi:TolA-binding protein
MIEKKQLIYLLILIITGVLNLNLLFADDFEDAKNFANSGDYQKAYEKLNIAASAMQDEIKNLQGLVKYYKDELSRVTGPQPNMDRSYNEAANSLWASAWSVQHDGVFKKTGREREEYLSRAVQTYKQIVIEYPYSPKAEEAQYQAARLYYKFLKDDKKAEDELNRYLEIYPNGRFSSEAKEILTRIRKD